jgi:hypothetical protein
MLRLLPLVFVFIFSLPAVAEDPRCGTREMANALRSDDSVYAEAMSIKASLVKAGVNVQCVLPSKMASVFEHQKGAALFRTNEGDFEALVLNKPYNFDAIEIHEDQQGGWFHYSFRGDPAPAGGGGIDSNRRWVFVKSKNRLFELDNAKLAAKLQSIFAAP